MLVEAYVFPFSICMAWTYPILFEQMASSLKGKILGGKAEQTHGPPHICVLVNDVVSYFKAKHSRQQWGFEGPDLEMKRHSEIMTIAKTILFEDIYSS